MEIDIVHWTVERLFLGFWAPPPASSGCFTSGIRISPETDIICSICLQAHPPRPRLPLSLGRPASDHPGELCNGKLACNLQAHNQIWTSTLVVMILLFVW